MKKLFIIMAILTMNLIVSCEYDDSEIRNQISRLEQRIAAAETVIKAYENNLYIQTVQEIDGGYEITFSNGTKATIFSGKVGIDGNDEDTYISSITVGENEVTFVLTDGRTFSIAMYSALSIAFDENDLVVMQPNSTREIHYTVNSLIPDVVVETVSSTDIKAKVAATSSMEGVIEIATGEAIDEYSKVIVFVSNGERVLMRRFTFEEAGIEVADNADKEIDANGGEVALEFYSNVKCGVVIPAEAQSWISVVPDSRAMEKQSITLKIEPNTDYNRNAVVTVQSPDGKIKLEYRIEQTGELAPINPEDVPDDEIWYRTLGNVVYESFGRQYYYDANVVSNTYRNGKGIIKFEGPVKIINRAFASSPGLTELYLPDCVEYISGIGMTSITTLRIPKNLNHISIYDNPKLSSFTGYHVSEDGKCVVIDETLYAFAPHGVTEYTIPDGVKNINDEAFSGNETLESIHIPEGVVRIGEAFNQCTRLKRVELPQSLTYMAGYAFHKCPKIEGFYGNCKFISDDNKCLIIDNYAFGLDYLVAFASGSGLTEYTIPEGVQGIESYAFAFNESLQELTFPNSLINFGSGHVFEGSENLRALYGKGTTEDHRCLVLNGKLCYFAGKGLKEYTIPRGVTELGQSPFMGCELETLSMTDEVTSVAEYGYIFTGCPNLKTVTLSAGFKNLGYGLFNEFDAPNLTTVYLRAPMPPGLGEQYHVNYNNLTIYVPVQAVILYLNSPQWEPYKKYIKAYHYDDLDISKFTPGYNSTDYSQDGTVLTLQKATKGNGIDIVMMGDAFSDRQIADGTYSKAMQSLADNLFSEEPYKSFKDMFNVYAVNVVSATEGYEYGNTALGTFFGGGTFVGGNDAACFEYASKAISDQRLDEALIIVAMNEDAYAGTCYMYYPTAVTGTYGSGPSVAYFPKSSDAATLSGLVLHEAGGHGFAKLGDEYDYGGAISNDEVYTYKSWQNDWGWYKNVDFTSSLSNIRWSTFINDDRYAAEGIGAYEGGLTYANGVWRPTENSIMRYNTGGFNAPSREAIYYRIHKLAYGDSWQYKYEDFVAYDAINRTASATHAKPAKPNNLKPLHAPVVVKKTWRQAMSQQKDSRKR